MTQLLQAGLLTVGAGVVLLSCAGLMLFSKLRSCEVLALEVRAAAVPHQG